MRKLLILAVLPILSGMAQTSDVERARQMYLRTDYEGALNLLSQNANKGAQEYLLIGMCRYMLGQFKQSTEALEQAARRTANDSEVHLWLGRAYGRRAETASVFTAPGLASKSRTGFERAVALNPSNKDAVGDLFDFYMGAPGFLGGGTDKAKALADKYRETDPAEYHYRLAQLAAKQKDSRTAEEQLRRAMDAAPQQLGRIVDLAKFLAKQGRYQESDAAFRRAEQLAAADPKLMFERAKTYIEARRNLDAARELLGRYLESPLTPEDPPRSEARELLKRIGSS